LTDEEFLLKIQFAIDDWAGIVNATGGSLKPKKCVWYMNSPVWNKGSTPITIPQPDGMRVPITLKDPSIAERKLGIYFAPNSKQRLHNTR
jgi:hypothetical protein